MNKDYAHPSEGCLLKECTRIQAYLGYHLVQVVACMVTSCKKWIAPEVSMPKIAKLTLFERALALFR